MASFIKLRKSLFIIFICFQFLLSSLIVHIPPANAAFGELTISKEAEMGRNFDKIIRANLPIVQDPEIVKYCEDLVARMDKGLPPHPFPFKVAVINHGSINAFAIPGGYIYIFTGLLTSMKDESQVAGVVGHEMAHVTLRHIAGRTQAATATSMLSIAGLLAGLLIGGDATLPIAYTSMAAGQAAMLKNSRNDENDADQVGLQYLMTAGYPPSGLVEAFKILQRPQWVTGMKVPDYLTTHPQVNDRINGLNTRISKMPPNIKNQTFDNTNFIRTQTIIRAKITDPVQAEFAFKEQLKGKDKNMANLGLGILYTRTNRILAARSAFDAALKGAPNDPLINREAGIFYYRNIPGQDTKAELLLEKAITASPSDFVTRYYYARLQQDLGDTKSALINYQLALKLNPEDPEVHRLYATALSADKQDMLALLHLAYSSLYMNDMRQAKQRYKEASNLAKTDSEKDNLEKFDNTLKEREKSLQ